METVGIRVSNSRRSYDRVTVLRCSLAVCEKETQQGELAPRILFSEFCSENIKTPAPPSISFWFIKSSSQPSILFPARARLHCVQLSWFPAAVTRPIHITTHVFVFLSLQTPRIHSLAVMPVAIVRPVTFTRVSCLTYPHSPRSGLLPSYPRAPILLGIWTIILSGISYLASTRPSRIFPKKGWKVFREST